jgi:hypothetical protein
MSTPPTSFSGPHWPDPQSEIYDEKGGSLVDQTTGSFAQQLFSQVTSTANDEIFDREVAEINQHISGTSHSAHFSHPQTATTHWLQPEKGEVYSGEVLNGCYHGKGTLTLSDGDSYIGNFQFGAFHDKGTYHCSDGTLFEGIFAAGKRHGKGILTFTNGDSYQVNYQDNKLIEKKPLHIQTKKIATPTAATLPPVEEVKVKALPPKKKKSAAPPIAPQPPIASIQTKEEASFVQLLINMVVNNLNSTNRFVGKLLKKSHENNPT